MLHFLSQMTPESPLRSPARGIDEVQDEETIQQRVDTSDDERLAQELGKAEEEAYAAIFMDRAMAKSFARAFCMVKEVTTVHDIPPPHEASFDYELLEKYNCRYNTAPKDDVNENRLIRWTTMSVCTRGGGI
ncbi:hypothetical protein VMCG_04797 [Cytospora schulzeri]|uniref:Uncharacterized protein n=1 Tax=Cytospora schulzeri TaxID=448051 RepID=A0A423WN42_9PEZI|nr:hypothetical protein VMCG_04797 [Valsa malicola]